MRWVLCIVGAAKVISWSHAHTYDDVCARRFLYSYGWPGIDVGGGEGRSKPIPVVVNRKHAIMGQVIQKVWEETYERNLWERFATIEKLETFLLRVSDAFLNQEYLRKNGPYDSDEYSEMIEVCRQGVSSYITTAKHYGIWGVRAKPELRMEADLGGGVIIGGRADFVFEPAEGGIILDGKNTKNPSSVKNDQLRWYALLYQHTYGVKPKKLGFVWYRYPFDEEKNQKGIKWVRYTKKDEERLVEKAKRVHLKMHAGDFEPNPSENSCSFCDYRSVCDARYSPDIEDFSEDLVGLK